MLGTLEGSGELAAPGNRGKAGCKSLSLGLRRLGHLSAVILALLKTLRADRLRLRDWWAEFRLRLGFVAERAAGTVWIHGEGVGEFRAAGLLMERWDASPGCQLLLTTSRPATRSWLAATHPHAISLPMPWDLPGAVRRYFGRLRPRLIVLLEFHDGFCPGVLLEARRRGVPVVVINARRLQGNIPWRLRVAQALGLGETLAAWIDLFCAQDEATRAGLLRLGVRERSVVITGNLKYDQPLRDDRSEARSAEVAMPTAAPVLVAGCIHADEERLLLETFTHLRAAHPDLVMILAPHDVQRVADLAAHLCARGIPWACRTDARPITPGSVLLLDTVGELANLYRLATAVVLGGSFSRGHTGHSLAEAAAWGKPIVVGPFMSSQQGMLSQFQAAGAVWQTSASGLLAALRRLLTSPEVGRELGRRSQAVVAANRGATARTVHALRPFLPPPAAAGAAPRPLQASWKRACKAIVQAPPGRWLLATRARRISSLVALQEQLKRPKTILCLGNGPSAEDPQIGRVDFDCLFRVNALWRDRGFLTNPDVVFTGDRQAMRQCRNGLIGFRTIDEELSVLLHTFCDRTSGRVGYFTLERLGQRLDEATWGARPTNGAAMIVTAAALQPERLIVGGVDLYAHPAGKYPGDACAVNAYAAVHSRDVEVAIIRHALARYCGELVIVGAALAAALGAADAAGSALAVGRR